MAKKRGRSDEKMDVDEEDHNEDDEYEIVALIRQKIIFKIRPKPIVKSK